MRDVFISVTINVNGRKEGKGMVQAGEARGRKSICTLVDLDDYDAACRRLEELKVPIVYDKNKPVVNIDLFKKASLRWFRKRGKSKNPP